jgi:hypothetical protein
VREKMQEADPGFFEQSRTRDPALGPQGMESTGLVAMKRAIAVGQTAPDA